MNKTYNDIINNAIKLKELRIRDFDNYYEKHHIIPRFEGGTDKDGLVLLTLPEHVEAHFLRAKENFYNIKVMRGNISAAYIIFQGKKKESFNKKCKEIEKFLSNKSYQQLQLEIKLKYLEKLKSKFTWYNDGKKNIRIFENDKIPENLHIGYIIRKEKSKRLERVNKIYERNLKNFIEKEKILFEKRILKLNKEYMENQKKIFPETLKDSELSFIPPEQLQELKKELFDSLLERSINKQSKRFKEIIEAQSIDN